MSEKGMNILHSRNLFSGLKNIVLDLSENCIYQKQKRVEFLSDAGASEQFEFKFEFEAEETGMRTVMQVWGEIC